MANPLLNKVNNKGNNNNNGAIDFLNQFNDFRSNFQGNPNQILRNAINSGKVTQSQVDDAYNKAQKLMAFFS